MHTKIFISFVGTVERQPGDCRTLGCGRGAECLREGAVFVCRCPPGTVGKPEVECRPGRTTIYSLFLFSQINPHIHTHTDINTGIYMFLYVSLPISLFPLLYYVKEKMQRTFFFTLRGTQDMIFIWEWSNKPLNILKIRCSSLPPQ